MMQQADVQPLTVPGILLLVVLCTVVTLHAAWLWRMTVRAQVPGLVQTLQSVAGSVVTLVITALFWDVLAAAFPALIAIMVVACLSVMRVIRLALLGLEGT